VLTRITPGLPSAVAVQVSGNTLQGRVQSLEQQLASLAAEHNRLLDAVRSAFEDLNREGALDIADAAIVASRGIKFPATQNDSTDANTLDDYEEQDVTPALKFGGNTTGIAYSATRGGKGRKIGSRAEVSGYFLLTSKGTATGAATIDGLPWASADRSAVTLYMENVTFANQFQGFLGASGTSVDLFELTEAGVNTALADTDFANDSFVMFSVSYYTA
jgi:phage/plasmid primase-like uncharacterized protein